MDNLLRTKELISRFIEGVASAEEIGELEGLIVENPSAADLFAEATRFESSVHAFFHDKQTERKARETLEIARGVVTRAIDENANARAFGGRLRRWISRRRLSYAAVAVMLVVCLVPLSMFMSMNRNDVAVRPIVIGPAPIVHTAAGNAIGSPVAVISRMVGARFSTAGFTPAVGDQFRTGGYRLTSGIMQLTFAHSPEIILEAPCEFDLKGRELMVLHRGRISAKIPQGAGDFTIETPSAFVVDQGTEFAVQVDEKDDSEVHVFDGIVSVLPRSSGTMHPTVLHSKSASVISKRSSTPCGIDVDLDRFLRSLSEPDSNYAKSVVDSDPALYFRMMPTGDFMVDSGPLGLNAAVVRGDTKGTPWTVGRIGSGLQFGGPAVKDYAFVPDYPKSVDGKLTVAAWVFAKSRPRSATIAKNWSSDGQGQFHFGLCGDTGQLQIFVRDHEGREVSIRDKSALTIGRWQHVAFVADGQMLRLYRNGNQISEISYSGLQIDPKQKALQIGGEFVHDGTRPDASTQVDDDPSFSDYWHGRIDEFAVFNHALNAEQIKQLFESIE